MAAPQEHIAIINQPLEITYKQQGQKAVKFTAMRYLGKIRGKPGLFSCSTIVRTSHWNDTLLPITLSPGLVCLVGTYRI